MPEIGEIRKAKELGYKSRGTKYIWATCPRCGKARWVQYANREMKRLCFKCANKNRRKEDILYKDSKGYYRVLLSENNFFISMANSRRCVLEHRLVMAQHLGRCLHRWEIVHHKGTKYPKGSLENRADNRIENLQLVTDDRHIQITILENRIEHLEERVTILEAENILLRKEDALLS